MLDLGSSIADVKDSTRRQIEKTRARRMIPIINHNLNCLDHAQNLTRELPMQEYDRRMSTELQIELILNMLEMQNEIVRLPSWLLWSSESFFILLFAFYVTIRIVCGQ